MSDTKERILYLGDSLIRTKGFNAFSYKDISQKLGIKNAAVHYHYPTKTDLVTAVVDDYVVQFEEFIVQNQNKQEIEQLKGFLDIYSKIQTENKICLIGAMASGWETLDDIIKEKTKHFADKVINWLSDLLDKGYRNGCFHLNVPARTKALMIITSIFAAIQLSRITGKDDFFTIKFAILKELKEM